MRDGHLFAPVRRDTRGREYVDRASVRPAPEFAQMSADDLDRAGFRKGEPVVRVARFRLVEETDE